jgi:hypothetical protein
LKKGAPQTASCWRYSFRHQLEEAKVTDGCMIELVEVVGFGAPQCLGKGQEIEAEMAKDVGTKVFLVYAPTAKIYRDRGFDRRFEDKHIEIVASRLQEWYEGDCNDRADRIIRLDE